MIKIGLKQKNDKKGIIVKALLDSRATELVISLKFVRKKKLDRPIYVRNMDSTFNHKGSIEYIAEIKLFYKGHKERMKINMIEEQK